MNRIKERHVVRYLQRNFQGPGTSGGAAARSQSTRVKDRPLTASSLETSKALEIMYSQNSRRLKGSKKRNF